ncbi:hypothetical protein [Actinokineospora fastidiosa]|uniref:hypothetical protein n=1 Tax=Actinokineospora fastidiosa TaxID=1816 RepID=UPI00167155F5|nr:hypothetical protein [Actinokineospora fastidiosa]
MRSASRALVAWPKTARGTTTFTTAARTMPTRPATPSRTRFSSRGDGSATASSAQAASSADTATPKPTPSSAPGWRRTASTDPRSRSGMVSGRSGTMPRRTSVI